MFVWPRPRHITRRAPRHRDTVLSSVLTHCAPLYAVGSGSLQLLELRVFVKTALEKMQLDFILLVLVPSVLSIVGGVFTVATYCLFENTRSTAQCKIMSTHGCLKNHCVVSCRSVCSFSSCIRDVLWKLVVFSFCYK